MTDLGARAKYAQHYSGEVAKEMRRVSGLDAESVPSVEACARATSERLRVEMVNWAALGLERGGQATISDQRAPKRRRTGGVDDVDEADSSLSESSHLVGEQADRHLPPELRRQIAGFLGDPQPPEFPCQSVSACVKECEARVGKVLEERRARELAEIRKRRVQAVAEEVLAVIRERFAQSKLGSTKNARFGWDRASAYPPVEALAALPPAEREELMPAVLEHLQRLGYASEMEPRRRGFLVKY
eukprot:gene125-118_t